MIEAGAELGPSTWVEIDQARIDGLTSQRKVLDTQISVIGQLRGDCLAFYARRQVNGQPVIEKQLNDGDMIAIGQNTLRFTLEA